MQAITAMAHLEACILYFIDISETCSYSINEQIKLFTSIKPLFKNKPLVIILNKTDIRPYKDLDLEEKSTLEALAKEHNTYMIQMSNETGEGVSDVKSAACEILLEYRIAHAAKSGKTVLNPNNMNAKDLTGMDKIYVSKPTNTRDIRKRTPNIPNSVVAEKKNYRKKKKKQNLII